MTTFEQVFRPHLDAAYNLARWLTLDGRDADDVIQEACLRALRFFPGFRGGDARAWLMRIVRNTCFTWMRANRPLQVAEDPELLADQKRGPEDIAMQEDSKALIGKALERLSPDFREMIVLREMEELSYREIAQVTGVPMGTVMSSLSRARGRLRRALIELGKENGDGPDAIPA